MDQNIILSLIGIVPAILSSIVTYQLAIRKLKYNSEGDLRKDFNKLSESLRLELKKELDECRTDREEMRKEYDKLKKELDGYKKENEELKKELNELEAKLNAANDVISTLAEIKKRSVKVK